MDTTHSELTFDEAGFRARFWGDLARRSAAIDPAALRGAKQVTSDRRILRRCCLENLESGAACRGFVRLFESLAAGRKPAHA